MIRHFAWFNTQFGCCNSVFYAFFTVKSLKPTILDSAESLFRRFFWVGPRQQSYETTLAEAKRIFGPELQHFYQPARLRGQRDPLTLVWHAFYHLACLFFYN